MTENNKIIENQEEKNEEINELDQQTMIKFIIKVGGNATKLALDIINDTLAKSNTFEEFKTNLSEYLSGKPENKKEI